MQSRSIDVGFVPEAETLFARAEKFRTTTLESGAFAWEFTDRGPNVAALREAARLGMTGIEVDRDLGGLGFGFREKVRVAEILSRSSIGFAFSLINTQNVTARLAAHGSDRHRDAYVPDLLAGRRFGATALTEPDAGSDFAAITTSAVRTDGGWVLNGRKAWITNAVIADVILCYAQTDPELGRDGIACFVVDGRRDGFEATDGYRLVAGSTVGVGGFSLDGYEAVEDDLLVEPGRGFRQALLGLNGARIYVAAMACAAVRAALGQAVDYGSSRESFGQPILAHQGLAWSLAAVANRLEAAEALTARAVDRHGDSQAALEAGDSASADDLVRLGALAAAHAKKFATEMVEPALEACVQSMGAEGLRADHVGGRLLSESRVLSYVDGTTEMQTERIGLSLSRYYSAGSSDFVSVAASTAGNRQTEHVRSDGHDQIAEQDQIAAALAEPETEPESTYDGDRAETSDHPEESAFLAASQWSPDPFAPSSEGPGLFADPVEEAQDLDWQSVDPVEVGADAADVDSVFADATQTMEFEPSGDVSVASGAAAHASSTPPEPPGEPPRAIDQPPETDTPMPGWPPVPSEPPPPHFGDAAVPSTPPMPPPPIGEPAGFGSPPPPPPPTGPPLSTDPPMPPEPPLPSTPPMPPEPPLPSTPPMPPEPAMASEPSIPPVPPPEFQQVDEPAPTPPPLPGDEHRLDVEPDDHVSTPPLPPDSMRTGG